MTSSMRASVMGGQKRLEYCLVARKNAVQVENGWAQCDAQRLDLVATRSRDSIALAARQYHAADNMTDRAAALSALSLCDVPERAAALKDFYGRYRGDPLIIDKWFTLQATIPEPATLDRVKTLTADPAFSFANPNRVRALIHAFASGNQKEFNRSDGAGYEFVIHTVLAIDPKNPQLAARLHPA